MAFITYVSFKMGNLSGHRTSKSPSQEIEGLLYYHITKVCTLVVTTSHSNSTNIQALYIIINEQCRTAKDLNKKTRGSHHGNMASYIREILAEDIFRKSYC